MTIKSWSHIGVCCSDLERSTRFYTEVLGFRVLFSVEIGNQFAATNEIEGTNHYISRMLGREDMRLELLYWIEPEAGGDRERRPLTQYGYTHLAFRVDRWDELFERCEWFGGTPLPHTLSTVPGATPDAPPLQCVYMQDPDGVRIECMAGVDDLGALHSLSDAELAAVQWQMDAAFVASDS
jgi:lactoylglutathione lyase